MSCHEFLWKGILIWDTSRTINCCFIIDKGVTSLLTLAVYQIVAHYLQCDVCRISLQTYFFLFIEIECDSPATSIRFYDIFHGGCWQIHQCLMRNNRISRLLGVRYHHNTCNSGGFFLFLSLSLSLSLSLITSPHVPWSANSLVVHVQNSDADDV